MTSGLYQFDEEAAKQVATGLLQIGAVELRPTNPFTWSSGWKSPIYCDNRLILSYPLLRDQVVDEWMRIIQAKMLGATVLVGTATAGIPHAAILADRLGLPMAYVRGKAKEHGKNKQIEGRVTEHDLAIVVEDTLSTGKSAFDAVEALEAQGTRVIGVLTIASYDFNEAWARAEKAGVPAYRLVAYDQLIDVARSLKYVEEGDYETLLSWRKDPGSWG